MKILIPPVVVICGSPIEVAISEDGQGKDAVRLNGVPLLYELLSTVNHTYCGAKVADEGIKLLAGGLQQVLDKYKISFVR